MGKATLKNITLDGFKSIRHMSLDLRPLSVLIGPNGAGKSNLVSLFRLLHEMIDGRLQRFVGTSGGANFLLYCGAKTTSRVGVNLTVETDTSLINYRMELVRTEADGLVFDRESGGLRAKDESHTESSSWGVQASSSAPCSGYGETSLIGIEDGKSECPVELRDLLNLCRVFHFHDTSPTSAMRRACYVHDNKLLWEDGGNLPAVLYKLQQKQPVAYRRIVRTIQQIAPWLEDFALEPLELNENNILLRWRQPDSDMLFAPHQLSDGTLRAMALVTLLLQPTEDLPRVIVIDEPELGLHPYAMVVVASLVRAAAHHCQIILATQSPFFLDQFDVEDVIVVEQQQNESVFRRLEPDILAEWLEEYSLSELWEKNVIGGGPA